jgi:hypothetical protein
MKNAALELNARKAHGVIVFDDLGTTIGHGTRTSQNCSRVLPGKQLYQNLTKRFENGKGQRQTFFRKSLP